MSLHLNSAPLFLFYTSNNTCNSPKLSIFALNFVLVQKHKVHVMPILLKAFSFPAHHRVLHLCIFMSYNLPLSTIC
ncbi:hypothetical protein BY458DRAFT_75645 [Sporodiniella umbellata]|nr:hypothetical protein BY458DRAFT_75645 [Sporodiniella umbellata]